MSAILSTLAQNLEDIRQQGLYRERKVIASAQGAEISFDGRRVVNFSSNDYLGLANHPAVVDGFKKAADVYGVGSGSAHLISGHGSMHRELEERLAEFTGRGRALLFSTGYMANMGVISALLGRGGSVLEDRLNHASLLDGARLSGARLKRYRHADIEGLEAMLSVAGSSVMIATDGVFSMDGDIAPVDAISAAAAQYGALLLVDDAHGLGVIGAKGGGVTEFFGLNQQQVPILIGTLGKAFGTFGAFAAGPEALIETLIQKARTYIYTTALPPAVAAATLISLTIAERETWRRDKLAASIERFRQGALQLGLNLFPSVTPIQPVLLGDNRRTLEAGRQLLEAGFLVGSIRPPTVPQGGARLRITLSAVHCEQHVDRLLDALAALAA